MTADKVSSFLKDKNLDKSTKELLKEVRTSINKNTLTEYMLIDLSRSILKRPYKEGEKVDIVFLFQSPSFWPSWESVWNACNEDERFNPIMLVSDDSIKEKVQFLNARLFLEEKGIPYKHISGINLDDIQPHIVILHTPYDGHRPRYLHGKQLSAKGYRTIYITYGIEISDIQRARNDHFLGGVTTTVWRLYTFSKEMIPYYKMFSPTGGDMVRSFGHPKFDYLSKEYFPSLPDDIAQEVNGRKVLLLKVHFPKKVNGKMITPSLDMYINFIKTLPQYKNLLCIFMPHPKFYEELSNFKNVDTFKDMLDSIDNLVEFNGDDYRPVIMNCDYYIVDRSAIMIEVGVTEKPILYVHTKSPELMTAPVQKIIDSYYQASTGRDITTFMNEVVIPDEDPLKEERVKAFNSIILDKRGESGYLIKEDIINSLKNERNLDKEIIDAKISDKFKRYMFSLCENKITQDILMREEREKVKRDIQKIKSHLSYKIGKAIIDSKKKPFGLLKLPFILKKVRKEFREKL